jgi:hypothetical protein
MRDLLIIVLAMVERWQTRWGETRRPYRAQRGNTARLLILHCVALYGFTRIF